MPEWIGKNVPKNPSVYNFTERIEQKIESVFNALPNDLIISVVSQESLENIDEEGISTAKSHLFRKEEEARAKPMFGVLPPGTGESNGTSFSHRKNLERFHLSLIAALSDYLRSLPVPKNPADILDFLRKNPKMTPAVIFWDGETSGSRTLRDGDPFSFEEISAGTLYVENILKSVSIDESDMETPVAKKADGKNICDILRKIIIEKSTSSLLRLSKEKEKEFLEKFYEPVQEKEWRRKMEATYLADEINQALRFARSSVGDDIMFLPGGLAPEGYLSHHITITAENYLENLHGYQDYVEVLETLPVYEKKIVANLTVHSGGSPFKIKAEKFHFGKNVRGELSEKAGESRNKLVYFGSNDDVELPMLIGAEHILMVDPIFAKPKVVESMLARIRKEYDADAAFDKSGKQIDFRFENKNFKVSVFSETMEIFNERRKADADVAIFFQHVYGMVRSEAEKALRKGGLFFSNK